MERNLKDLEILAPCGNLENFNIALNMGADAVYLGLSDFNARMKADNFNKDNISNIVERAHLFGTKVYLTLNTLIKTKEFPKLIETIKYAIDAKVDAFIIQDLGIAKLLKDVFPGAIMHASTQLGVHNLYGAKILEKLGFSRVVLSRETKLEDIKEISKNTNLEIEYFVHGALCVAFSGNCYLSSFKFGESGNRGRCLQLCRLPYKETKSQNGYLLSPADLCLIKNLKTLIDAGVTSFKIEGRLKRAGYVARTVFAYKKALENLNKNWNIEDEINHLKVAFSRGEFNENAYLKNGTPNNIINPTFNNHSGLLIGKVLSSKKFKDLFELTIKSSHAISSGDGLKFFENTQEIGSMGVGNVIVLGHDTYKVFTKRNIKQNANVYLTLDAKADEELTKIERKIEVLGTLIAKENLPLELTLSNGEVSVSVSCDYVCPSAKNKPTTKEEILSQISKLGETNFTLKNLTIESDNVFIPKSVLNEIRRSAIEKLEAEIILNKNKKSTAKCDEQKLSNFIKTKESLPNFNFKNIIQFEKISQLKSLDISNLKNTSIFALSPEDFTTAKNEIIKIQEQFKDITLALNLPIIASGKDLKLLDSILEQNKELILIANNLYALYYISLGYKVIAGTGLNIFNKYSADKVLSLGAISYIQSAEQSKDNLVNCKNSFIYSLGYFPLMTFAHCPHKTINQNTCLNCSFLKNLTYENNGVKHKIRRYKLSSCYFELLNSNLINNISKHDYNNFIDIRELSKEQIELVSKSIISGSNFEIEEKENYGMLLKEIK